MTTLALWAALAGLITNYANEVLKQDNLPKWANTLIADVALVISAALTTVVAARAVTWHTFWVALVSAFVAAVTNHTFVIQPLLGGRLQTLTSFYKKSGLATTPIPPVLKTFVGNELAALELRIAGSKPPAPFVPTPPAPPAT